MIRMDWESTGGSGRHVDTNPVIRNMPYQRSLFGEIGNVIRKFIVMAVVVAGDIPDEQQLDQHCERGEYECLHGTPSVRCVECVR